MAENSNISWCDHTFNPWIGCQKVSPGCDSCYAEALMDTRFGKVQWGPEGERKLTSDANWRKPLTWNRKAATAGERPRVFCASLADVFDNQAPQAWRRRLWSLILDTPNLDWLLLTKRPQNISKMMPWNWLDPGGVEETGDRGIGPGGMPRNVWLGTSTENQEEYDRRWPILAATPAVVRFVSVEPLLDRIDYFDGHEVPDWAIVGGESGPNFRPMDPEWARHVRWLCALHGIAFWYKQGSGLRPGQHDTLDGVRYHELPTVEYP